MSYFEEKDSEVLREIVKTQIEIFELAEEKGYDMESFAVTYMTSDFCNREMDSEWSYYHFKQANVCLPLITGEITKTTSEKADTVLCNPGWVGGIYRYLAAYSGLSSREVVKILPPAELDDLYYTYENCEYEEAAHDIIRKFQ